MNRANGCGTGTGRKRANLTRLRECRMKVESRFPRHFAVRHGTPCGRNPPPRQLREGNGWQNDKWGLHADGLHIERKKPSEALFFPSFCTRRNCLAAKKFRLCGRRFISLRKAILLFPRKNDRRDGEMLHTNSLPTRFLTVRPLFAAARPVIETWKRKENLSFWQEISCWADNPTRALLQVPTELLLRRNNRSPHKGAVIRFPFRRPRPAGFPTNISSSRPPPLRTGISATRCSAGPSGRWSGRRSSTRRPVG